MNEEQRNEQNSQEVISAREKRRQELESIFNPTNMKVIRKELFPSPRDPAVTFRNGSITFNTACINGLEDVVYVNLFFDENLGLFSVTGCDENDKQALRWCVAKPDKRRSRRMRCPDFTDSLFKLMGWNMKCRYKVLGYQIQFDGKTYYVFDLNVKQVFNEKAKKGEEPVDEYGQIQQVDTRHGYYPEDIANTFGVPMEQHLKETEVSEMDGFVNISMFTGVREDKTDQQDASQQEPSNEIGGVVRPGDGGTYSG